MARVVTKNVYEKSNTIDDINVVISERAKTLYKLLLLTEENAKKRQRISNQLCAELCKCFKTKNIAEVRVVNVPQDSKTVNGVCVRRTFGKYIDAQLMIIVFNKTAVRKQIVAIKTFADTLLHEFVHYLDRRYYNLADSPHTAGFYKRVTALKQLLK